MWVGAWKEGRGDSESKERKKEARGGSERDMDNKHKKRSIGNDAKWGVRGKGSGEGNTNKRWKEGRKEGRQTRVTKK